ncbi:MAG: hypothetical protein KC442_12530 [Thermomicrobiales bacterium]|nr:hypothetical protein [Thermomicrobiales bacterium]
MVIEALSQLGLPTPQLASASGNPWPFLLACAIIWLALSGGRAPRRSGNLTHV